MNSDLWKSRKSLSKCLEMNGYKPGNLTLLGRGSEGAIFSNGMHIFKYFFNGPSTLSEEKITFISQKILCNHLIFGIKPLSNIIHDKNNLVFVSPYDEYCPYRGGAVEKIVNILLDAKKNRYIFTNFHPKNLMYDSSQNLKIIDLGRSLEPYNENGYQNMVYRAYLSTYFSHRNDLQDIMTEIHKSTSLQELEGVDCFIKLIYDK